MDALSLPPAEPPATTGALLWMDRLVEVVLEFEALPLPTPPVTEVFSLALALPVFEPWALRLRRSTLLVFFVVVSLWLTIATLLVECGPVGPLMLPVLAAAKPARPRLAIPMAEYRKTAVVFIMVSPLIEKIL